MSRRGRFITLEGIDGAGKSSHADAIAQWLGARGRAVVRTREPGGTPLGEALRELLLNRPMTPRTEALLAFAARCEHLTQLIEPALAAGQDVLCDRFTDATFAYQGGGRELGFAPIALLQDWVDGALEPDRTYLFDLPPDAARARREQDRAPDRFEREQQQFFDRVRAAYLARAAYAAHRIVIIDAGGSIEQVRRQIEADLTGLFESSSS